MNTFSGKISDLILKPPVFISIFIIFNLVLFVNILSFNSKVGFNRYNYDINAHKYTIDHRMEGKPFNLIESLGQFDAQWYLKIASEGYPKDLALLPQKDGGDVDRTTYAFFPLYPLIISSINIFVKNIELSAFTLSVLLIPINFLSLIYVVKKHFNLKVSVKASYLLFFFPFSIFFRSYFSESIFLFLLIWFSYFLYKRKYLKSSLFLSLLNVTKSNGFFLNIIFLIFLLKDYRKAKITLSELLFSFVVMTTPFVVWLVFNYVNTGNLLYFMSTARTYWNASPFLSLPFLPLFHNIALLVLFPVLPFHSFHTSQVDIIIVFVFLLFLVKSKKHLPKKYWLIAFCLWLLPLLVSDTMSFSRYQSVNFPIFIYLARVLDDKRFIITFLLFFISLMITSLFFVNWWWVG